MIFYFKTLCPKNFAYDYCFWNLWFFSRQPASPIIFTYRTHDHKIKKNSQNSDKEDAHKSNNNILDMPLYQQLGRFGEDMEAWMGGNDNNDNNNNNGGSDGEDNENKNDAK